MADTIREHIEKKLEPLMGIFAQAALGNFDHELEIPDADDEFAELYSGIQIMLNVIHQKITSLEEEIAVRKKIEAELLHSQSELKAFIKREKKREQHKDDFIALASHEMKTPITSLKIFTQGLERLLKKKNQMEFMPQLQSMNKQLTRLADLVNDLLDASRAQKGKLEYKMKQFAIDSLIEETVDNMQRITLTHKLIFNERVDMKIVGDRDKIEQVLINFLTNAVKYSPDADTVIIRASKARGKVLISVQDFGMGIPKDQQKEIFGRFYQVDNEVVKTYPGLGLGLYISSQIIQRHRGEIWVESEEGKGSTFYFSLPVGKKV